jgi:hypothetical protein
MLATFCKWKNVSSGLMNVHFDTITFIFHALDSSATKLSGIVKLIQSSGFSGRVNLVGTPISLFFNTSEKVLSSTYLIIHSES